MPPTDEAGHFPFMAIDIRCRAGQTGPFLLRAGLAVLFVAGLWLGASPAAATITGTWVAEIRFIVAEPGFPDALIPDLKIGDRITYSYEVLGDDLSPSPDRVEHFVSPHPAVLTGLGTLVPPNSQTLFRQDDRDPSERQLALDVILEFDLAALGVVPPPPRDSAFGFFDLYATLDCTAIVCEKDALPLGRFDFDPSSFDPNHPFDGPNIFIEVNFQGGGAGPGWYAGGPVLSVVHTLPEPGLGVLLLGVLAAWRFWPSSDPRA